MDLLIAAGRLPAKLVAGEIQNLQPLIPVRFVKLLQRFVLRREAAAGGGVDNQQYLALVISQRNAAAILCLYGKIVDAHIISSFYILQD